MIGADLPVVERAQLASVRKIARSPVTLVLAYLITIIWAIAHHPMWLDEAQAWCVARDSHSLHELFWNLRYDGHPALWYLCLFALTRLTHNPVAMQVLHGTIATATVALIAFRSPFAPYERWLLAFGYLFSFEYAIISRGYALGVLLAFAVCVWCSRPERRVWSIALALAALANTSVYGTILALCFLAALGVDATLRAAFRRVGRPALAAAVVLAGCGVAIATMKPAADYAFAREWHTRLSSERLADTANQAWLGWAPLPDFSAEAPWDTSIVPSQHERRGVSALLAVAAAATLLMTVWSLRATPMAAAFHASGILALLSFVYLKYSAGPRHSGHLFVVLVAAIWLARDRLSGSMRPIDVTLRSAAVLQVIAGVFFLVKSAYVPFSWSQELVSYVRQIPARTPVVVADATLVNYVGPVLSAYLQRPVDYVGPGRMRRGSFMILDEAHHAEARPGAVRRSLEEYAAAHSAPTVLLVASQWHHADKVGPAIEVFRTHLVGVEGVATVRVVVFERRQRLSRAEEPAHDKARPS